MVGAGRDPAVAPSSSCAASARSRPELLEAVIDYLGDGNEWAAERLAREPGWVIDSALRSGSSKVFAAHLTQLDCYEIAELRLGKKTEAAARRSAPTLHKQLDRYAYGAPPFRFTEERRRPGPRRRRADRVRARQRRSSSTGRCTASWPRTAIKRTVEELREQGRRGRGRRRKAAKASTAGRPIRSPRRGGSTGASCASSPSRRTASNLDLGAGLLNGLSTVDPADMDVARFFVFALLGADYDRSPVHADRRAGRPSSRCAGSGW